MVTLFRVYQRFIKENEKKERKERNDKDTKKN
jgi:hypothetical protein